MHSSSRHDELCAATSRLMVEVTRELCGVNQSRLCIFKEEVKDKSRSKPQFSPGSEHGRRTAWLRRDGPGARDEEEEEVREGEEERDSREMLA